MAERPFHHGNLRAALLERAETMLQVDGPAGLSLRELARQAGVSHGAPRSHFIDRQALLDALAVRGFERLTDGVRAAAQSEGGFDARFRRIAQTYVAFAIDHAPLMELMFTAKAAERSGPAGEAAARLFEVLDSALQQRRAGGGDEQSAQRFKLLFAATMQGIAALVATGRATGEQGDLLVEDAVDELLASALLRRAVGPAD